MSEPRKLLRRVVVVGDGPLGILAACAIRQALPLSDVVIIATEPDPLALADRIGTSLPFSNGLHDRLGVDEDLLIRHAGASHRLVMRYDGWGGGGHGGAAPYGTAIDPHLKTGFAREWGGGPSNAATITEAGSVAEALALAGRFMRPDGQPGSPLADVDYALRWNVPAYRDLLIGLARQLGVSHISGPITGMQSDGQGGIAALGVEGGDPVHADLWIDCSGPQAGLLSRLPGFSRQEWEQFLPVRKIAVLQQAGARITLEDSAALTSCGWLQRMSGRDGQLALLGMAEDAETGPMVDLLGSQPQAILPISQGRANESWLGNVVALGDAAAQFEPLGFFNLDLAHRQLSLLLEMMPGQDIIDRERAEYNRRAGQMADRTRDVLCACYAAPAAAAAFGPLAQSEELALALDQFARRGRIPFFEEMPFLPQEWATMLQALGLPQGQSALDNSSDSAASRKAGEIHRARCEAALRTTPDYAVWMKELLSSRPG